MFYTYILFSEKLNKYYIGSTNDLERRLADHQRGKTRFAKAGKPWKLVYSEEYPTRAEAFRRETYIKKQKSRIFIEELIGGSEHPGTPGGSLVPR